jgi:GntR family transcriptional regulator/MocR family aminotransferase
MDSPVEIPYKSFIKIDRNSEASIYMQITNQLINAIQRGFCLWDQTSGNKNVKSILEVHRNTIVAVYDELFAQGWVESFPNKGTFIIGKTKKNQLISIQLILKTIQNQPDSALKLPIFWIILLSIQIVNLF